VGSVGDSRDNALAETVNGPHEAELIHQRSPRRNREQAEAATLDRVHGYDRKRLPGPTGHDVPPRSPYHAALHPWRIP